jgi:hypothetical protein
LRAQFTGRALNVGFIAVREAMMRTIEQVWVMGTID